MVLNEKDQFIKQYIPNPYTSVKLKNDASFRFYERVKSSDQHYIFMDSSAEKESLHQFVNIAKHLENHGFSVPKIHGANLDYGYALLEDFGIKKFNEFLIHYPEREEELYLLAADLCAELIILPKTDLKKYDFDLYLKESVTYVDWFLDWSLGKTIANQAKASFSEILKETMESTYKLPESLVLRDFMADNLMLLEERSGINKLGILDFQDAVIGNPVYDLVSLLEDARRDVSYTLAKKVSDHFISRTCIDEKFYYDSYYKLSAQRNLKIIGYFTRKYLRDNNSTYLAYIPRVMNYLRNDLEFQGLEKLKTWFYEYFDPNFQTKLDGVVFEHQQTSN